MYVVSLSDYYAPSEMTIWCILQHDVMDQITLCKMHDCYNSNKMANMAKYVLT